MTAPYTEALYAQGFRYVAGTDEAGRGPLAGPVVAAAVLMPRGAVLDGVNDSKRLSPEKRTALAAQIKAAALSYGIAAVEVETIDRINILQAALRAMAEAVQALSPAPDAVLADGPYAPPIAAYCQCLPHGDALDHSVAAASILAKVHRDALMLALHAAYPQYGFDRHKGYPTAAHRAALTAHGPCPAHRKTFKSKAR